MTMGSEHPWERCDLLANLLVAESVQLGRARAHDVVGGRDVGLAVPVGERSRLAFVALGDLWIYGALAGRDALGAVWKGHTSHPRSWTAGPGGGTPYS